MRWYTKNLNFPAEAGIFFILLVVLSFGWLGIGPSNQELLANYAKAKDLADLIWMKKGFAWWTPNYLGGSPTAIQAGNVLVYIWLLTGASVFGPIVGGKIMGILSLALSGSLMAAFLEKLTGERRAAWVGALFYALGPQAALRLVGNEHMPAVFCMPYPPLIGWALLEISKRGSGRGGVILGLGLAGMSLTFNKLTFVFLPVALGFGGWLYFKNSQTRVLFARAVGVALGVWVVLGIFPQLPGLRDSGWMTLFSSDPLVGWQSSFSLKAALSWLNRDGFFFAGMPPNFTVEEGGFYVGAVLVVLSVLVGLRLRRDDESNLHGAFRIFAGLLLIVHWFSLGPRSMLGGVNEFLKSAQGVQDWVLPLFWITAALPIALLVIIWPKGRWKWPTLAIALAVFLLIPGFQLVAMLPVLGTIRGPWSFWQVGGVFCLGALAGISVAILIKERRSAWVAWVAMLLVVVDFAPYYSRFFKSKLEAGTYEAFQETARVLQAQTKAGSIFPLSGRYFYMQLPQLSGRPISTEAFQAYFMSKGVRSIQDAGGGNEELMKTSLSLQGVRYIFIDRKDVDTPEALQNSFRKIFPVFYENEFFTVLENPNCLAPFFYSRDYVLLPSHKFQFAGAVLGLVRLYFLPVEMTGVEMQDPSLAGIMNPNNGEVELTEAFRDRLGNPFRIPNVQSYRMESPDQCRILIEGESGWLTLTQAWHPDWRCSIDGQQVEIHPGALAFSSVRIPAGAKEALFRFAPPIWASISLGLGIAGWIFVLIGVAFLFSARGPAAWNSWWGGEEIQNS
jgi:hypothetical protein